MVKMRYPNVRASEPLTPLLIIIPILMIDAIIQVGMVGAMVGFLHDRAGKWFDVKYPTGSQFQLHGKPHGLLVDQGHTSNGAGGTAFVLIGIGGLLAIWHQKRRIRQVRNQDMVSARVAADLYASKTGNSRPTGIFTFWVVMTILSNLLTLGALIYTFVLTAQTDDQSIDLAVAAANPEPLMYPLDDWTPENWFVAVLDLPLAHASDRRKIRQQLRLMRGWRWNLIPLFILGFFTAGLAVWEWLKLRRARPVGQEPSKEAASSF
jgi:hypothetical protein